MPRPSNKVTLSCKQCGDKFQVPPSRIRLQAESGTPVRYCSRSCFVIAHTLENDYTCVKCGEKKGPDDFSKDTYADRGYNPRCKACMAEQVRKVISFKPHYRATSIKGNARKRDLPYTLTREQFMSFWQKPCTYCGDAMPNIGLDRVDNSKGYTMDNVVSCCGTCNAMKSTQSYEEFVNRCQRIVEHIRKNPIAVVSD